MKRRRVPFRRFRFPAQVFGYQIGNFDRDSTCGDHRTVTSFLYRLSATRLEPGGRADGVVVFDRPNFKESTEKLFLQIAQADQVDRPILICLPFTPPISGDGK
jgi:hypothetical protein